MTAQFSIISKFDGGRLGKLSVESKYGSWTSTTPTFLQYFSLNAERLRLLQSLPIEELCLGNMFFLDYSGLTSGSKLIDSLKSNPKMLREAFGGVLFSFPLVDLSTQHIDAEKTFIYGPASSADFLSKIDLEIVAPPLYVCRATLDPEAASTLDDLNLESTKLFFHAYGQKIDGGASAFAHLIPKLSVGLEEAGFDPRSLDGVVAASTMKMKARMDSLTSILQLADERWQYTPRMIWGGTRLQLHRLVNLGADLISSPEPFWRALYYQYLAPLTEEGKPTTIRVRSPKSLRGIECDCPVCERNLLVKRFSEKPRTQFVNLLCIHNNNTAWRQLELTKHRRHGEPKQRTDRSQI